MSLLTQKRQAGKILGEITARLYDFVSPGVSPFDVEQEAQRLIKEYQAEPSFTKVKDYHWATCVNVNDGIVHGIPTSRQPFSPKDLVTVDIGIFWQGVHSDNAFTKTADGQPTPSQARFLKAGQEAIAQAIAIIRNGLHVGDISHTIAKIIRKYGYSPIAELGGHGVGRHLHEEPFIPCAPLPQPINSTPVIKTGQTLAIEVIYSQRSSELVVEDDNWTISTKDGKLAAVFEETVEVLPDGSSLLTTPPLFQRL